MHFRAPVSKWGSVPRGMSACNHGKSVCQSPLEMSECHWGGLRISERSRHRVPRSRDAEYVRCRRVWRLSCGSPVDHAGHSEIARAGRDKLGNHRPFARCGIVLPPWNDFRNNLRPSAGIVIRGRPFGLLVRCYRF